MARSYEDMLFDVQDSIATLTLNRPEKLNALSDGMRRGLREAIRDVQDDDGVKVMIVTGSGDRGFCSGADISTFGTTGKIGSRSYRKGPSSAPVSMLRHLDKPVIAAVNGVAAGAGFGIALACDFRIASENASFVNAFIRIGLASEWGVSYWLPRLTGMSKALDIMLTGRKVGAAEAERLGIVSQVVPATDLMKEARALAATLTKQPPMSVELIKRMAYAGLDNTLDAQLAYEMHCAEILVKTEDCREGIAAFREKREPRFKGV